MDGRKRKWAGARRRGSTVHQSRQMSEVPLRTTSDLLSRAARKQHGHEESRNRYQSFMFEPLPLSQTQISDWVKSEEAASLHLRSSMTLTMISNGDKCSVKELQAHAFLPHSRKDGIKREQLWCVTHVGREDGGHQMKSLPGESVMERCVSDVQTKTLIMTWISDFLPD